MLPLHAGGGGGPPSPTKAAAGAAAAALGAGGARKAMRSLCGTLWPSASVALPASATEAWICYAGLAVFFPAILIIKGLGIPHEWRLVLVAAVPAAVVAGLEVAHLRPALRASTGLQFARWAPSWRAVRCKLLAMHAILAAVGAFYWVASEYERGLYKFWFVMLRTVGPYAYVASLAYFVAVDGYQSEAARKEDLYHNLGRLLLRQPPAVPVPAARWQNMGREYLVKVFFLPLMASFYSNSLKGFEEGIGPFVEGFLKSSHSFVSVYGFLYDTIFFVDTMWATFGYVLSCKLLDSHVRSAEPTFAGWSVALSCYPPFVYAVLDAYCTYSSPKNAWGVWFKPGPRWLFCLWGLAILALSSIYCWATVIFGLRFSNLTNRGIITNGPYAYLRHPAYVCKNISWWMIAVPWSMHDGAAMAFKRCVRLAMVNAIYYARAKTEEAHLLRDPAYLEYFNAMQRRYGRQPRPAPQDQQQQQQEQQQQLDGGGGGEEKRPLLTATAVAPNGRHA